MTANSSTASKLAPTDGFVPAALFFDVDGTLVCHPAQGITGESVVRGAPSPGVVDAFRRLRANGHLTFICTGRAPSLVSPQLLALEPTGIVAAAGACVLVDGEMRYEETIPEPLLIEVAERFERAGAAVILEGSQGCVAFTPRGVENGLNMPGVPTVASARELAEATSMRFNKFSFTSAALPRIESLDDYLLQHFARFDLTGGVYEMCLAGVDKGAGVRRALELVEHGQELTFGFGDSENDLPMLAAVETPVAMGNALPHVKEAAAYVTCAVEEDGVPRALEHFGLI